MNLLHICHDNYYCLYNNKAGAFTHNPATMAYRSPTGCHIVSCAGLKVVFSKELDDGFGSYDHQYSAFERFNDAFTADWAVSRGGGHGIYAYGGWIGAALCECII